MRYTRTKVDKNSKDAQFRSGDQGKTLKTPNKVFTAAQVTVLAREIAAYLPKAAAASLSVGRMPFRRRNASRGPKYANPMVVDTSVLIDGRILDVAKSGFIYGTFLILPSVVSELHTLSDSADDLKRKKGRRGLDVLSDLSKGKNVKVEVLSREPEGESVDSKLVSLAKQVKGSLMTVDFNLNKVATIHKVKILNLNELANALKPAVLPHETLRIKVNAQGKEKGQGVGYLADGTMVVVEKGAGLVGETVNVVVHKVLQTAAGKMIFAKPATGSYQ